jgi:hypothetical protein
VLILQLAWLGGDPTRGLHQASARPWRAVGKNREGERGGDKDLGFGTGGAVLLIRNQGAVRRASGGQARSSGAGASSCRSPSLPGSTEEGDGVEGVWGRVGRPRRRKQGGCGTGRRVAAQ